MATIEQTAPIESEPLRTVCASCERAVIVVVVLVVGATGREPAIVTADAFEWEPRAACQSCAWTRARLGRSVDCARCDNSGFVGTPRPAGRMLAIDVAWSDDSHLRLIGPRTRRRMGEALHALHDCDMCAIVPLLPNERRQHGDELATLTS